MKDLREKLKELDTAEDFLDFFNIPFNPEVVQINRLHILQRFHNYIDQIDIEPINQTELVKIYKTLLLRAYTDFQNSNALNEKVFKVFQKNTAFVPLSSLSKK